MRLYCFQSEQMEHYLSKYLVYSLLWSLSGDGKIKMRHELGDFIRGITTTPLPPTNASIIDYEVILSINTKARRIYKSIDSNLSECYRPQL